MRAVAMDATMLVSSGFHDRTLRVWEAGNQPGTELAGGQHSCTRGGAHARLHASSRLQVRISHKRWWRQRLCRAVQAVGVLAAGSCMALPALMSVLGHAVICGRHHVLSLRTYIPLLLAERLLHCQI